ncbi:ATP-dependent DNA helicase RecG [Actinomyces sp. B33]|uniref:ATP-dependent DNA helicase RecG n=1 Tax=Actinomyces sp. B33 TaxID=2942131 RepID=UPI00233F8804|nr:ATP-dependent DNA helicase RecG [Actinomyces sp. B33]MDC4233110.1 ATP-dependent DNA helicase RecG [Actinomyces sp. B33]
MNALDTPIGLRVPQALARKLDAVGVATVGDLLALAPRRYYHWGRLTPLSSLRDGDDVTILAEVASTRLVANRSGAGVRLEVDLTDGSDRIGATFFAKNQYKLIPHERLLVPGASFLFAGKVGSYRGRLHLTHPSFEGADGDEEGLRRHAERPIPIYPSVSGLTSWRLARAIGMALDALDDSDVPDVLDETTRAEHGLPTKARALRLLHRPQTDEDHRIARTALAWEEALILQTALVLAREGAAARSAPACPRAGNALLDALMRALPFDLTDAQRRAVDEIGADLEEERPMQRLLQGDVGSGKTVVALAALMQVVGSGHQGALVAPTEVLAEQHFSSITRMVEPLTADHPMLDVRLLTGSTPTATRRHIDQAMRSGAPLIVVGTHALLQDSVSFADLGLVVVDEQHRFGVAQRDRLRSSHDRAAHQLVMTATPIPRTVAMTVFGDLDETRMTGLPPGRSPVATHLVDAANAAWMGRLWERAREEVDRGGRVYVVCPRIDEDEAVADSDADESGARRPPLASVSAVAEDIRTRTPLADTGVRELTGRTGAQDKARIMEEFASGAAPVLVATTVVEVGVDVPEATMIVIVDAQQFGLSQLHQLRGRVGRSSAASICMAVHRHELTPAGRERLEAFASTTDGFALAEADLVLRREGDVLGADQSGRSSHLEFLSVRRDAAIIEAARTLADGIVAADPDLSRRPELRRAIADRSGDSLVWLERS